MSFKVLTLNNISVKGLRRLPRDSYEVASEIGHPDAILVRSYNMHDLDIPDTVKAIGRAGAGVNNIPIEAMTHRGVPVFNAPGANANAVKELVIAAMLLAARNICPAWRYVLDLDAEGAALNKLVEAGKKKFVGFELPARTLGVVGLGAIGGEVANAAHALGMRVIGFDPQLTVEGAWRLSSGIEQARSLDDLFSRADIVTFHVPLNDSTRHLANSERLALLPEHALILNFARGGIVDDEAVAAALAENKLAGYVTDFPVAGLKDHPRVVALPHLGASTGEAEENCAIMVADNVKDYLENGNIRHSVNFPESQMPREGDNRLTIANMNVPNMVGQISTCLADAGLNIHDMLNKSLGDIAYTLVDLDGIMKEETMHRIRDIDGVLSARIV